MIERFNKKQVKILEALARYKFLTYSQIIRIGIFNHRSNLSNSMKYLRDCKCPLVRKIPHRIGSESKHYLTKFGMEVLSQLRPKEYNESNIQYLKKVIYTDTQDQLHRTSIIDIQIELDFACLENQVQLLLCERYFDTIGNRRKDNNLTSKTAVQFERGAAINADLTFMIKTSVQNELYLLELENGSDTGKGLEKCIKHGKAILAGTANTKYRHESGYRTLWVFEKEATMQGTMKKVQASPFFDKLTEFFLFKSKDKVGNDFRNGWLNASGLERKLYYI